MSRTSPTASSDGTPPTRARAAVLRGERDPHQAELAELAHDLVGKRLAGIQLAGDGCDAIARELAHRLAQQRVIVGEVEVHGVCDYTEQTF